MVWVAGGDGCKKGWFRVSRETETAELRFHLVERARDLLEVPPQPCVLALDIPIGLPKAGPRDCDKRARKCLNSPRQSSVFPAPIRPALNAMNREEASQLTKDRDGREVGVQAWALYPKIREVDELLQSNAEARQRIREVHPEICFWSWSGRPMVASKKTQEGKLERRELVEKWLGPQALVTARHGHQKKDVADDDILDAFSALWTAHRMVKGVAKTLPENPPLDETGLRMEIVY